MKQRKNMRNNILRALVLSIAFFLSFAALARAQFEDGYPFRLSNFRIELTGGWTWISPDDLNVAIDYENAYLQHFYLKRYGHDDEIFGGAYSARYVFSGSQAFKPLKGAFPLGAAIRYQASPTLALSLGVQYQRRSQSSGVGLDVIIDDARPEAEFPGTSTARYSNDDLTVSVEYWMPYLAANFGWDFLRFLRGEIFVLGGPIFADLRVWNERHESLTTPGGTVASGTRTMEMTGRSTSLAVEAGVQLRARLLPFLEVVGRAGYALRDLTKVHGRDSIVRTTEVPAHSEAGSSHEGTWGTSWEVIDTPWGTFKAPILTTDFTWLGMNIVGPSVASVALSGFHLSAGLSIRL